MRLPSLVILFLSVFQAVHCEKLSDDDDDPHFDEDAPLGTGSNPFPEDHEAEEHPDAPEAPDHHNQGFHEDTGEQDELKEDHLRELHKKLDKDGDGKVHLQEIMHYAEHTRKSVVKKEIESIFDEIPSTQDGHLSMEEHLEEVSEFHDGDDAEKELQRQHEIEKFKAADLDNDGKLDKDELVHMMHPETHPEVLDLHVQEEMRKRDTNKDGKLDPEEWKVDAAPGEHQSQDQHDPEADFKKLDENGDGFLDITELKHYESGRYHTEDAMKKLFETLDMDGDKHMTVEELVKAVGRLEGHDAHPHLLDWIFHEEL